MMHAPTGSRPIELEEGFPITDRFQSLTLRSGMRAYLWPTTKFKNCHVRLIFRQPLSQAATAGALLPMVLRRGTAEYPSTAALVARLEELYGAELRSDTVKFGEQQWLIFDLDVVSPRYLPGGEDVLPPALELLCGLWLRPPLQDGHLRADWIEQEKVNLGRLIDSVINDKAQYAQMRMIQTMCAGEPYAISRYGRKQDIAAITADGLTEEMKRVRSSAPLEVYAVGDFDPQALHEKLEAALAGFGRRDDVHFEAATPKAAPQTVRTETEHQPVNQGKLAMGYRTQITAFDEQYPALVVMNGIFGAYSHSKLFQNVREKASLAYYAVSRLDGVKGILSVQSGIDAQNFDAARAIIAQQLEDVQAGRFEDLALENTMRTIENQLRSSLDSPGHLMMSDLESRLTGRTPGIHALIARLRAVSRDDIVAAARGVSLDTVYFLTGEKVHDA